MSVKEIQMTKLLRAVQNAGMPVGALYLSDKLNVPSASLGRMLRKAEDGGLVRSVSNKGRCLTDAGESYLKSESYAIKLQESARGLLQYVTDDSARSLVKILKVRLLLEPWTAEQAAVNAADSELAALRELQELHSFKIHHGDLGADEDLHIHLQIAKNSGNEIAYQFMTILLTTNHIYPLFSSITSVMNVSRLTEHKAIIDALCARDSGGAKLAMEQHIDRLLQYVKSYVDSNFGEK